MQKRYGTLEKFLYTNPAEEASFLSGAFQTVSYGAASLFAGPVIALAALWATHKTFAKPYLQSDKPVRHAHLKGFASGLVLSIAVAMAGESYSAGEPAGDEAGDGWEFSERAEPTQPRHLQSGPAHI